MSTKKPSESHQAKKPESPSKVAAILVILCFLGIMPMLVWVTLPESSPYTSVTTSNVMVEVAADAAGLQICSSNGLTLNVTGATSSVLYQLSPNCGSLNPATTVQILVVGFSSTDAQNAAISSAMATYQAKKGTDLQAFTSGYNVILVQGSSTNPAVQTVANSLIKQGAKQIPL